MILHDKGLYYQGIDLWMDSKRIKPSCYISHAHADHTAKHKRITCTPETAALTCHRLGNLGVNRVGYDQWVASNGARFKLFPAGHILGSSQILIETDHIRLVYTGDFRLGHSRTCLPAGIEQCDILVMETTYGAPQYLFPRREETEREFAAFVLEAINNRRKPIVMAYTLGKAQEAIAILASFGIDVTVERDIYRIAKIYERFGIKLGKYSMFNGGPFEGALIIPPHMKNFKNIAAINNKVLIFLSGWGIDGGAWNFHGIDRAFLISDHCDYESLVKYVEQVNPKRIFTLHGFEGFAQELRSLGYDAVTMKPGKEYNLSESIRPS